MALDHWTLVVLQTKDDPSRRALSDMVAKDCVRAFAMVGRPDEAVAFFRQLHATLAPVLLQRLIEHYRDLGQLDAALIVQASMGRALHQ